MGGPLPSPAANSLRHRGATTSRDSREERLATEGAAAPTSPLHRRRVPAGGRRRRIGTAHGPIVLCAHASAPRGRDIHSCGPGQTNGRASPHYRARSDVRPLCGSWRGIYCKQRGLEWCRPGGARGAGRGRLTNGGRRAGPAGPAEVEVEVVGSVDHSSFAGGHRRTPCRCRDGAASAG